MPKDKTSKSPSAFQRFENFTKALVAVPKKELQAKLAKYKQKKAKTKGLQT